MNVVPKFNSGKSFSNKPLDFFSAHNYTEISILTIHILHEFDIICFSEAYLNSESSTNDRNLEIPGYNMFRVEHSSNNMRECACIFLGATLP